MNTKTICFIIFIISISYALSSKAKNSGELKANPHYKALMVQLETMSKQDSASSGFTTILGIIEKLVDTATTNKKTYETLLKKEKDDCDLSMYNFQTDIDKKTQEIETLKKNSGEEQKKAIQTEITNCGTRISNYENQLSAAKSTLSSYKTNKANDKKVIVDALSNLAIMKGLLDNKTLSAQYNYYHEKSNSVWVVYDSITAIAQKYRRTANFISTDISYWATQLNISIQNVDQLDYPFYFNGCNTLIGILNQVDYDMTDDSLDSNIINYNNNIKDLETKVENEKKSKAQYESQLSSTSASSTFSNAELTAAQTTLASLQKALTDLTTKCTSSATTLEKQTNA